MGDACHNISQAATLTTYTSFILLGFLTSLHCVGMCGPISTLFMTKNASPTYSESIKYNISRLISYCFVSGLLFLTGITFFSPSFKKGLAIALLAIILLFVLSQSSYKYNFFKTFILKLQIKLLKHIPNKHRSIVIGLFTGIFPCGLLYTAYTASFALPHYSQLLISIFVFWLGTVPALFISNMTGFKIIQFLPLKFRSYFIYGFALISCIVIIVMNF